MYITYRPLGLWPADVDGSCQFASQFKSKLDKTMTLLKYELSRLDARDVTIEIDLPPNLFTKDGKPRAGSKMRSARVIVSFESVHGSLSYAAGTFHSYRENLRAIALGLGALRALERYGITGTSGRQYRGFKGLAGPAGSEGFTHPYDAARFIAAALDDLYLTTAIYEDPEAFRQHAKAARLKNHPDLHPNNPGIEAANRRISLAEQVLRQHHETKGR